MKQIFTLVALMASMTLFAQTSQNFETQIAVNNLTNNCWTFQNFSFNSTTPITGSGDIKSPLGTISEIITPFQQLSSGFTISFNYRVIQASNGADKLKIDVIGTDGVRNTLDRQNNMNGTYYSFSTTAQTGIKKIVISINNTSLQIDNLNISSSNYYQGGGCNRAPQMADDVYQAPSYEAYNGASVTANDTELDGESTTISLATPSPDGTVSLNANGTFTFTPNADFTGTSTTFTYRLTDNGYAPANATATVTINFNVVQPITLPIKLTAFTGNLNNNKVQLSWSVDDNETGKYFQVQRSADGKNFSHAATVLTTTKTGTDNYKYEEALPFAEGAYYRIQIVNKDQSIAYSKIVSLKGQANNNKISVTQNPIKGNNIQVNFSATNDAVQTISLYNLSGVQVYTKQVRVQKGMNAIHLTMEKELAAGAYILESRNGNERQTLKLTK